MKHLKWYREHSEWFVLPMALLIWFYLPFVLRWIDPTAGSHDIGMLQTPFLGLIFLFIGVFGVMLLVRVSFFAIYKSFDSYWTNDLTEWQRRLLAYFFIAVLLLTYAVIVSALI